MIRKDKKKFSDGTTKTYIRVTEGYRPGRGLPPRQRTIRSFGYLEDQENPDEYMRMVEEFDRNMGKDVTLRIEVPSNARMYSSENRVLNYGYKFLEAIYDALDIDGFVDRCLKRSKFRGGYPLGRILKFLVLCRILVPDSKRASFQMKNGFYGLDTTFDLQDVYRTLDCVGAFGPELQKHLNEKVRSLIGRDLSHAFYDVTNYFFEIDFPDEDGLLRKRGVSKEHRTDPIVQMGLFMDANGLPVSMSLFPGNTSDCATLQPAMQMVREEYGLGRIVVVADKGMNSSKNIDRICRNGDGYVVSQVLRGKKGQRYHQQMFSDEGYVANAAGTYKYKLFEEEYEGLDSEGKKETRKRKVLIYWDEKDARMAKKKRDEKLAKAQKATRNNAYSIKKGIDEYTKETLVDPKTGEVLEDAKRIRSVDEEKAAKDAMFDGYFCIITSELDYTERQIRQVYGSLWKIEQSFRILKSDLDARPVYVRTASHITAHFLICFLALLIVRMMQHRMGKQALPAERIARVLSTANCSCCRGGILHLHDVGGSLAFRKRVDRHGKEVDTLSYSDKDEIAEDYRRIQDAFHTDFYYVYPRQEVFNKFLRSISQSITKKEP